MLYQNFTHLYPLSKTLRFELKPVGKTREFIHDKGFLSQDENLSEVYKSVKVILDDYHRDFIAKMMSEVQLTQLAAFYRDYMALKNDPKNESLRKTIKDIQDKLRKEIIKPIQKGGLYEEEYGALFSAKLFKDGRAPGTLAKFVMVQEGDDSPKLKQIAQFEKFSTYFTGFHENRRNMYSGEDKHTAIAYRLIHENLPRFVDNLQILTNLKSKNPILFNRIDHELKRQECDLACADSLEAYQQLLTQSGIDGYNKLIGQINFYTNHHNQTCHKSERIPKLKPLHKQILSDGLGITFLPSQFADDDELCGAVNEFYRHYVAIFENAQSLFAKIDDYDVGGIYVSHKNLNELSKRVFGDFGFLARVLDGYYTAVIQPDFHEKYTKAKSDSAKEKMLKEKEKYIKSAHALSEFKDALAHYATTQDNDNATFDELISYLKNHLVADGNLIRAVHQLHSTLKGFLEKQRAAGERILPKLKKDSADIANLKAMLDNALEVAHFAKLLQIGNSTEQKDERFYGEFSPLYDDLAKIAALYNKTRDYISQKPYSTEKYKLNFGNPKLLSGWDLNKEKDNFGVILQKDGCYYLALLDKNHKRVFEQAPQAQSDDVYQKMVYKQVANAGADIATILRIDGEVVRKTKGLEGLKEKYFPQEINRIRLSQSYSVSSDNFNKDDLIKYIDFYKDLVKEYFSYFNFSFKESSEYKSYPEFISDVDRQGYKVHFVDIDSQHIDDLVAQGKLYLFQIYNQDFSLKAHGKPNLHTLYFKALFDKDNLEKPIYKLNGEAEIFYRKASLDLAQTTIHPAGELLKPKNPNGGNERVLTYDVIKDKRYTEDKFLLHMPITMNFGAEGVSAKEFNRKVNAMIKSADEVRVIGIDRGERHLLYVTVVDGQGRLIEQHSLNDIISTSATGVQKTTSYHTLLSKKGDNRQKARKDWGEIEEIKGLKSGYLSHVVHQVTQLMLKHDAIVVMEDLNFGFKRGRFKVEKQVYQNFENALIKKLNFLVLKDKIGEEVGSAKNALQLTSNFSDLKSIGKQTGFILYVPAWNTSKIDPVTGFVDLLKPQYENVAQSQALFGRFDAIFYNAEKDYFEFHLDYAKFTDKARDSRQKWTVCSHGKVRYAYDKTANQGKGASVAINVNDELKSLFEQYGIDYHQGDLVEVISQNTEKNFHRSLIHLLKVLLALRYSHVDKDGVEHDFILSPVADDKGRFFDSSKVNDSDGLPKNADANGAYHIALKGLWAVQQIKQSDDLDKVRLSINNQTWLHFAQNR